MVRITTWNVNGIRNPFGYEPWRKNRTFSAMFDILETDIIIMQELKIQRKDLTDDMVLVPGWDCYFSLPKHKKGYSGVGIYTRQSACAPVRAEEGLLGVLCPPGSSTPYRERPESDSIGGYPSLARIEALGVDPAALDAEGRCLVLEFPAFVLFGVYSPANSNGLRDNFRYGFLDMLDTRIRNLTKMGKNVILTGDLNVSRDLIDTAKAEDNMKAEGMTHSEYLSTPNRRIFNQLLLNGIVPGERDEDREEPVLYDLCREFHPHREGMYTHWEQKINARPGNFGSRIDFVLCSIRIKDWFQESNIQEGLMGSDHCPVYAVTKDKVLGMGNATHEGADDEEHHILDIMNPPGMFRDGVRLREYNAAKDLPSLSGKLLTEFNKRQNIRDMFSRKPTIPKPMNAFTFSSPDATLEGAADISAKQGADEGSESKPAGATNALFPANDQVVNATSPLNSPEKRRASASASPDNRSIKRSKASNPAPNYNAASLAKGQQSLKGFFQSRPKALGLNPGATKMTSFTSVTAANGDASLSSSKNRADIVPPPAAPQAASASQTTISPISACDPGAAQQASKEGWTKLFSKRPPPRCEGHAEPCITLTTKKPGVNRGRQFWMCPRPIGPSGQKESGTQWRCGTFIWASDWKAGD
ncbi:DNA-(apurinic or apyrimidinic site) lyase [Ascochyta rabiei]|uniref:DNA-(apurinic or apyrimidinic site) endonuclease 2 n=1 Tax=Didymella rabiei TaxID=5454 RepID=A0A163DR22_DIDRA|nr:DNA-(apurinic or apyrimidinic site) lyase [Ascochyta rabiei]KZM23311.1 DNA binding [Ascochyta rabiei]UPX13964.1 DNA-(apurinic or apyrimidinic site) lyase [Ascochyta rabiei]